LVKNDDIIAMQQLEEFRAELQDELSSILSYWQQNTVDTEFDGFYGKINNENIVDRHAPKGSVLNSRILWSYSAAYNFTGNQEYLELAQRAFGYFGDHFIDKKYGGVFWSVDYKGNPLDTKKQIYALAFAIYGFSEFYSASKNELAREKAIELFHLIVDYSYDKRSGGYIEALSEDWKEIKDLRLSQKDANEKKSMNTHLHVLEGFSNLYRIWSDENLKTKIVELLHIFMDRIICKKTNHLVLFFDDNWNVKSNMISYGHDIEAAWLLQECAAIVDNKNLLHVVETESVKLARAAGEGLDSDGGLWYEYDITDRHLIKEKHSWPQAEAMIGFFNAWELSTDENYLAQSLNSWKFLKQHIINYIHGEWYWGVDANYSKMQQDKVGIWKCPYHNTRACIELIRRIMNKHAG
jgi:cellobiose epimerase